MSTIQANTLANLAGTGPTTLTKQQAARAFVTFNGVTTTTILKSLNIASLVDGANGVTDVNFTTNFSDGNYCMVTGVEQGTVSQTTVLGRLAASAAPSASTVKLQTHNTSGGLDRAYNYVSFLGELA